MEGKKQKIKPQGAGIWGRLVALVSVFCILASLAIVAHGSLFGHSFEPKSENEMEAAADSIVAIRTIASGEVVNTTSLAKDVVGYGGPVPVEIYISDGKIDSIRSLPNSESPGFFGRLEKNGLTHAWDGKTLAEAADLQVDAVTGATYSSNAYIANVRAGVAAAMGAEAAGDKGHLSVAMIVAIAVVLMGAVIPLFVHNPTYRIVQQVLNVAVLGFWAGTFLDYAMMMNFFARAPQFTLAFIMALLLLVVGFIYPLFGRPNYYCTWICPFGSLQELAGKLSRKKLKIGAGTLKFLDGFRQALWVVLLLLLYIGWGAGWVDYEIFTGFIVESASWIVIGVGLAFVVLSIFISRPFCRFVCPTGSILKNA